MYVAGVPLDLRLRYPSPASVSRIRIARGSLSGLGAFVRAATGARRALLVTDAKVASLHGGRALRALRAAGISVTVARVPRGERAKTPAVLARLWRELAGAGIAREDTVIALGGGVVGDLAGFAAATWLRGVPWVGVPTTVLSQVDASVGGKTAVDLAEGKNLVGAFHQPAGVLVDPDTLATLPARQRRAGLAEVVKTGLAVDAALFRWIERNLTPLAAGDPGTLEEAVKRSIRAKARVVAADEREREGGGRTALNLGHTLGHAIEAAHGYRRIQHGEAVAIGLRVALRLSERAAGLAPEARARGERVLDRLGLPRTMPPTRIARLEHAMRLDKKRRKGLVRWVLTPRIGHASVPRSMTGREVRAALIEAGARE